MHKFVGSHTYDNGEESYTYELTFNQSMIHTGLHRGIEDGMNRYRKHEKYRGFFQSLKNVWHSFINLF